MAIAPIFKRAYWSLAIAGALYFAFISLLLNGWIQRQAFYAHKVQSTWLHDPNKPENFGFLKNQVQRLDIRTPDREVLWGWHVLPLTLYVKNEGSLIGQPVGAEDYEKSWAFRLLAEDPESRLIVYFHGNAGTVAQGWRTDTYRAITAGASDKIHLLTVDYRGYGKSTGSPTEAGLIIDGISLVQYAMEVARIPPERIVIVGQSLGSAVATAVAEHFALEDAVEFRCLILCAAFSDVPTLMATYTIGGLIPILSPLRPYPFLAQFFAKRIQETWFTFARLANLVRKNKNVNIHLIHATNDYDIPWSHSDTLFRAAANATSVEGLTLKQIDAVKLNADFGESGWTNIWKTVQEDGGRKIIRQDIVKHGGHNRVVTYPVVAKAVFNAFYMEDTKSHFEHQIFPFNIHSCARSSETDYSSTAASALNLMVMDNSNIKSEPADSQPTIKDEKAEGATCSPRLPPPLAPPQPPPPPPPLPKHRALPPRITRADFITPDQRAIFGPAVEPLEWTDRVGPDGL